MLSEGEVRGGWRDAGLWFHRLQAGGSVPPVKGGVTFPFVFFGVRPGDWLDDAVHGYELHFVRALDEDHRVALARRLASLPGTGAWSGAAPWRWQGRFALVSLRPRGDSPEAVRALHAAAVALFRAVHAETPLVSVAYLHAADAGSDPWDDYSLGQALGPVPGPRWEVLDPGVVAEPGRACDESVTDPAFEAALRGSTWRVERTERRPAPAATSAAEATATPAERSAEVTPERVGPPRAEAPTHVADEEGDEEADEEADEETEARLRPEAGPPAVDMVSPEGPKTGGPLDWSAVARLPLVPAPWPTFGLQAEYPKAQEIQRPRPERELAMVHDRKGTRVALRVEAHTFLTEPLDQDVESSRPSLHPTRDAVLYLDEVEGRVMLWEPPAAPRALPIPPNDCYFNDCAWLSPQHFGLLAQEPEGVMVFALDGEAVSLLGLVDVRASAMQSVPGGFVAFDLNGVRGVSGVVMAFDGEAARVVGAFDCGSVLRVSSDGPRVLVESRRAKVRATLELGGLAEATRAALLGQDEARHPRRTLLAARIEALQAAGDGDDAGDDADDAEDEEVAEADPASVTDPEEASALGQEKLGDGEYEAAVTWLLRAIELQPTAPQPWNDLGVARSELGDGAGATAAWEEALRLYEVQAQDPAGHDGRFLAAAMMARLGRREAMMTRIVEVLAVDRGFADQARDEEAFDPYWSDPEFKALMAKPKKAKKLNKG